MNTPPVLSITIKTLDEEAKIGPAIESALAAANEIPGPVEIVIADSLSTDKTVGVASRYPVRVVQFVNKRDCGCGAGVQLGYCLLYTSPSPRDGLLSRMPSSA